MQLRSLKKKTNIPRPGKGRNGGPQGFPTARLPHPRVMPGGSMCVYHKTATLSIFFGCVLGHSIELPTRERNIVVVDDLLSSH